MSLRGRFVAKGDILGTVAAVVSPTVRVAVPEARIELVRHATRAVKVRFAHVPSETVTGFIAEEVTASTQQLSSALFGSKGGGSVLVDARDEHGMRALEPVFEIDIGVYRVFAAPYLGGRVMVRFEHTAIPITQQPGRLIRQLFLAHLPS